MHAITATTAQPVPSTAMPSLKQALNTALNALTLRHIIALMLAGNLLGLLLMAVPDWPVHARAALGVFGLAVIGWTVLQLDDTPVALAASLALIGLGVAAPEALYASLGESLIWLLIGAFVLAAVLQQSGLAERWALRAVAGAGTAQQLLVRLTWVILATTFIVPSTSGRAALLLPVFLVLARAVGDVRIVRALTLLFPSVILLSACASLLGAGAHLVAVDFMRRIGHEAPSFALWAWWAAPFAVLSSFAATALISALFLDRTSRHQALTLPAPDRRPLSNTQRNVVTITLLTVAAWATTGLHGVDATLVALLGALAITCKPLTGVDMKAALKKVEWNLVLFLAATLVLGEALLHSGAAKALADALMQAVPLQGLGTAGVLMLAVVIALLSHLLITSRTARALVLLPTVALPLAATGLNPALLIFVCVVGSGFCQTLAVSAKPVALFARAELPAELTDPRTPIDVSLLHLSLALLPVMVALLCVFAYAVWPAQGLPLRG
jgi:solute carrier family 13 (sodium-dependent dicarboxylate transporter), member 2/3/5